MQTAHPPPPQTPFGFRFQFIRDGSPVGRTRKGLADSDGVSLADAHVPYARIEQVVRFERRLALSLGPDGSATAGQARGGRTDPLIDAAACALTIGVKGDGARTLKRIIDREISLRRTERARAALVADGRGPEFRAADCPACGSRVELSSAATGRYAWCPYCQSIWQGERVVADGERHRVCPSCGLFGRVRPFTEWYFLFLLVFYYVTSRRHELCGRCAGRLCWAMFAVNSLTVVAIVPFVIWRLATRERSGPEDARLGLGNRHAARGRADLAAAMYDPLYRRWPDHPGLLLNELLACLNGRDPHAAADRAARLLAACPNYQPALDLLADGRPGHPRPDPAGSPCRL